MREILVVITFFFSAYFTLSIASHQASRGRCCSVETGLQWLIPKITETN